MINVLARCTSVTVKLQISGAIGKILTSWSECYDDDDSDDSEDDIGITISHAILEISHVARKLCNVIKGACDFPSHFEEVAPEQHITDRIALIHKLVWIITRCVKDGDGEQRSEALCHFGKCGAIQSLSKVLQRDQYSSISHDVMGLLLLFSQEPSNLQEFHKVSLFFNVHMRNTLIFRTLNPASSITEFCFAHPCGAIAREKIYDPCTKSDHSMYSRNGLLRTEPSNQ
jgi:hypothetical protein